MRQRRRAHDDARARPDLYARALAFADGKGGSLILVHTTNIGLFASYKTIAGVGAYHVRQEIAARTGVPADHVIVQADHSHAGPDTIGIWGGVPTSYLQQLQDAAVDAAVRGVGGARARATSTSAPPTAPGVTSSYDDARRTSRPTTSSGCCGPRTRRPASASRRWSTTRRTRPCSARATRAPRATGRSGPRRSPRSAFGGTGLGSVGTLGREDFGAKEDGDAGEAEARARLDRHDRRGDRSRRGGAGDGGVDVRTTFIREPIAPAGPAREPRPGGHESTRGGYDISIDRDVSAAVADGRHARHLRRRRADRRRVRRRRAGRAVPRDPVLPARRGRRHGARAHFHLGASNDFLGYMLRPVDHYPQVARARARSTSRGCPEEELFELARVPDTTAPARPLDADGLARRSARTSPARSRTPPGRSASGLARTTRPATR